MGPSARRIAGKSSLDILWTRTSDPLLIGKQPIALPTKHLPAPVQPEPIPPVEPGPRPPAEPVVFALNGTSLVAESERSMCSVKAKKRGSDVSNNKIGLVPDLHSDCQSRSADGGQLSS